MSSGCDRFKYMLNINIIMGFKTVTIKHSVYNALSKEKLPGESFSEMFQRMMKKGKPNLLAFAGAWKSTTEDIKKLNEVRKTFREGFDKNAKERMARLQK